MAITFGRFSDSFKPKAKIEYWNQCEKLFQEKKYLESYDAFFKYLKDDELNNVKLSKNDERIDFELLQGSKIISGYIGDGTIIAEADIAEFDKLSVAVMRRLMELNYTLFYTRFALKDNRICIKFDSTITGGPPRKLYYAWKELAMRADKQDDLLVEDFASLKSVGNAHIEQLPDKEKEIKYKHYKKWLDESLKRVSELNEDSISGGISYLLLNAAYKIDYLIAPEGTLMNELEKMSWQYFARDNKPFVEKNRNIKESLQKLLEKPKDEVIKDFYKVTSTFGIANPAPHQSVVDLINNNINNVKWYVDNNYTDIAVVIYEYIATYSLFSYGLPKPDAKLFHLLINIVEQPFFNELGFNEVYFDNSNNKFNEQLIKDKISGIIKEELEQYPELKFSTDNLKFDSLINFLRSYILEMQQLNFNN
ncbi:MAG: YbjN domain-containing protein [Chlorobi bacterium]|nr:YbjN domain-containing protein [Chlorobiota bacterium]MCI0716091.1 YbjN domain-containing protein [Chlorobiota bacterium]